MKLSKTSWHYWLHSHTFDNSVPSNLCPYFWQLVFACICFIPLTILFVPYIIKEVIQSKLDKVEFEYPIYFQEAWFAIFLDALFYCIFCMVAMWWNKPHPFWSGHLNVIFIIGIIGWFILLIIGIVRLCEYIKNKSIEKRIKKRGTSYVYKEPKPNILIEFIKAKYQRYCPTIEWGKDE